MTEKSLTSIVLAGGESKRLGQDKASLKLDGEAILERVLQRIAPLSGEVILALRPGQVAPSPPSTYKIRTVADPFPGAGSLGGIYSGLMAAYSFHSLVVACDMPFLNTGLLDYMTQLSPHSDIVIPRIKGNLEPLHAIYSKNCLGPIQELLERRDLRIAHFFDTVRMRYVEEEEVNRFDPRHLSFFNINTEEDLEEARRLVAQEKGR